MSRIAIVGGGPGGLTLGLLLHKHNIPFTIFELRPKPTEEELDALSGMLDLHEDSGLLAVRTCGLYDEFVPLTGECTEDSVLADETGNVVLKKQGGGTRPEISRNQLARLFLRHVPEERIRWGHRLVSAQAATSDTTSDTTSAQTELDFGAHGKHVFDLVVGADGAWSRLRGLLTEAQPRYTGYQMVTVTLRHMTATHPALAAMVGTGSFFALGRSHAVVSQRGPQDSARLYLWLTLPDESFGARSGLAAGTAAAARAQLLEDEALLGGFGAAIRALVDAACAAETADHPGARLDLRPLYALPHGTAWPHRAGVTLLGDAAHVMLPNGEGVNAAMLDAVHLSRAVVEASQAAAAATDGWQNALDPRLAAFEMAMVDRAKAIGAETDVLIGTMFGENAAEAMADMFLRMGKEE